MAPDHCMGVGVRSITIFKQGYGHELSEEYNKYIVSFALLTINGINCTQCLSNSPTSKQH